MARQPKAEADKCVKVSVSFDKGQLERLIKYCQEDERSISWCVRKALEEWLQAKGY